MSYHNFNFWQRPYQLSKHRKALQWSVFSRNWYLFDAKWQDLYDAASKVSVYLQGKHKPIYDQEQDLSDHVVVINTRHVSLPNDEWRYRMFYHHTRYAKGRTWAGAYELHVNDPTILFYKACYKLCGSVPHDHFMRRLHMCKLHLYPDGIETVPAEIRQNIVDQIRQVNPVFKSLSDYSKEEIDKFPKITEYPDEYVIPKE